MAKRPVFITKRYFKKKGFIDEQDFIFEWYPGFSSKQKQKSIYALHKSVIAKYPTAKILEVSSKSQNELGFCLSAFNLLINDDFLNKQYSVESAFQSSKVFENGGPFNDIIDKSSREAKKDIRLKESGKLKYFKFKNDIWELEPKTSFYDWLYINALLQHDNLVKEVINYNVFTDIEFNPSKSINCQARSVAIFVSLYKNGYIDDALKSIKSFINLVYNHEFDNSNKKRNYEQITFNDIK